MNEPTLISLENLVVVGKNPPGKPADEGGNAWIKEIRGNGEIQLGEAVECICSK
jgi:hypothetical protein